jgi:hypothetical protein
VADAAETAGRDLECERACAKLRELAEAIIAARPTELAPMAAQLRWLARRGSLLREDELALQHLAEQLERLAGSGAVVLSADAAARIRCALVTVLEDSGGGIGPEDDPDLSPGIGAAAQVVERQLRNAHELLEQTGGKQTP